MNQNHPPKLLSELQLSLQGKVETEADGGVLVSYIGIFKNNVTDSLLLLTEQAVLNSGASRKQMRRVGSVLIECLQNVGRHGWVDNSGDIELFLTLEKTPLGFQIQCGNWVDIETAAGLRTRLAEVNSMTHEALRVRYVETLCEGPLSSRGGAGLGLLSMAKKSNGPMDYHFREEGKDMFLFTLAVMIKN